MNIFNLKETERTWCVTEPYSEFVLCIYPSKCTHTQQWLVNKRAHTHTQSSGQPFFAVAPGEQLGVRWLEMSAGHSLPLQFLLVQRLEPVTCGLQVRLSKPGISYPAPGEPSCRLQFQLCCNTHVCNYQVALNTLIGLQLKSAGW